MPGVGLAKRTPPVEMSLDERFSQRIKRLVAISATALGIIFVMVYRVADAGLVESALMIGGWITMPALLALSLRWPRLRYLLVIPAGLVASSLVLVASGFEGSAVGRVGWWTIAAGVLFGGTLGGWFWYRLVPVPPSMNQPFTATRWALIVFHAALVVIGVALVLLG